MNQERITLEIPTSRKAIVDCYNAPKNRKLMYYLSLATWIIVFIFILTILPLTATSSYRVAFYLPLVILMLILTLSTHWLIQCALLDYHTTYRHHIEEQTVYNVMAEDVAIQ